MLNNIENQGIYITPSVELPLPMIPPFSNVNKSDNWKKSSDPANKIKQIV